jgi:hypothetical protein
MDRARQLPPGTARDGAQAFTDLLTPIAKAWCTDRGCDAADLGIQVHGGLGFIEQTGAAQIYRDARITPIYEGTNGIQAIDLLGRKLCRDGGETVRRLCEDIKRSLTGLARSGDDTAAACRATEAAVDRLVECSALLIETNANQPARALAGASAYLRMIGTTIAAWRLLVGSYGAHGTTEDRDSARRRETALYFAGCILPETLALDAEIKHVVAAEPIAALSLGAE